MALKTKATAEDGKQELRITRDFDLPVELLFRAHAEPEILQQWMSNAYATMKVLKLEGRNQGAWEFASSDPKGNVVFQAHGVIHEFIPNQRITRTFEMNNSGFGVQLEFMEFAAVTPETSRLNMHIIFRTVAHRDQMLQIGMAQGMSMAHDHLEKVVQAMR